VAPAIPFGVSARVGWDAVGAALAPERREPPAPQAAFEGEAPLKLVSPASKALRPDILQQDGFGGSPVGRGELAGADRGLTARLGGDRALAREVERIAAFHEHVAEGNPFA
jgi:hypothetical protein